MILILDNYDSFTYNLYQLVEALGFRARVVRNDAISVTEVRALNPRAIILSPGPGAPRDAGISLRLIQELAGKIPILGVCLGHQAIGEAFGGEVVRLKRPMHGKTSIVRHDGKTIFHGLESPLQATRYHSLVVRREKLPACLEVTAETEDRTIMGIRHRRLAVEGVQFHPESHLTPLGQKLLANFLEAA